MQVSVVIAEALTRRFDERTVVDHLDLSIGHGEIFGLLGPNGAGKSTTIKMLITLLEPSEGNARLAGFDIKSQAREVRRRVGYVPQLLSADGMLTARENLRLSARLYGLHGADSKARIAAALRHMGLEEFADRLVKTYSGGMIRRLELAQAMLHRPSVLVLDEPTIGLDPVARRTVWDRLEELRSKLGTTILITTHDMDEADHLCDRLAILHQGRISVIGTPAELKARIGPEANLDDVFTHFSGATIEEGGSYRDVRNARTTANRLS